MNVWMKRLSVLAVLVPCLACAMEATPENLKNELNTYIQQAEGMSKAAIDKVKACNLSLDQLKQQAESAVGDAKKNFEDQLAKAKADATTAAEDAKSALAVAQKGFDEKINECQKGSGTLSTELLQIVQGAKQRLIAASNELTTLGVTAPVIEAAKSVVVPVASTETTSGPAVIIPPPGPSMRPAAETETLKKPEGIAEKIAQKPSAPAVGPGAPEKPKVKKEGPKIGYKDMLGRLKDLKTLPDKKEAVGKEIATLSANMGKFDATTQSKAKVTLDELKGFMSKPATWEKLLAHIEAQRKAK